MNCGELIKLLQKYPADREVIAMWEGHYEEIYEAYSWETGKGEKVIIISDYQDRSDDSFTEEELKEKKKLREKFEAEAKDKKFKEEFKNTTGKPINIPGLGKAFLISCATEEIAFEAEYLMLIGENMKKIRVYKQTSGASTEYFYEVME